MGDNYKTYNDGELLRLLTAESEPALKELYNRYWESLFTKAYNFLNQEDAAKDCVQEVFIWLWQHRHTVSIANVNHYLHQAVRYQAFKALREQKAAHNFNDRLQQLTKNIFQDDILAYKEIKVILDRLIASLPDDQRVIFLMHREQSLTYKQIAEQLDISVKTVEKKMSQSLSYLRLYGADVGRLGVIFFLLS